MSTETTMRAISQDTLGGAEVLELVEAPRPQPMPTEVLVRTLAAGVNPVDWKVRARGGFLGEPPFTVGWDVAGVVEEVGYGVTRFAVGDRVFGMPRFPREAAAYAEYVTSPSRQLARSPTAWTTSRRAHSHSPGSRPGRRWSRPPTSGRAARPRPRRGRRGRAPGGADREGTRCLRARDRARGEALVPGRPRRGRADRLHQRERRPSARVRSTSCSTSSAARPGSKRSRRCATGGVFVSIPSSAGLAALHELAGRPRPRDGHPRGARPRRSGGARRARRSRGAPSARVAHVPVGRSRPRPRAGRDGPHPGQARPHGRLNGALRPRPRRVRRSVVLGARDRPTPGGRAHGRHARPTRRRRRPDAGRRRHTRSAARAGLLTCSRAAPSRRFSSATAWAAASSRKRRRTAPSRSHRSSSSPRSCPRTARACWSSTQLPEGEDDQIQANIVIEGEPPVADALGGGHRGASTTTARASRRPGRSRASSAGRRAVATPVASTRAARRSIPRSYVLTARDHSIPPALQRRMIRGAPVPAGDRARHRPHAAALGDGRARAALLELAGEPVASATWARPPAGQVRPHTAPAFVRQPSW